MQSRKLKYLCCFWLSVDANAALCTMDRSPGPVCFAVKFSSSNLFPYILTQPLPSPCSHPTQLLSSVLEQTTDVSYTISSNPRMLKIEIYQKQNKPCNQQWMPHFCKFSLAPSFQIPKPNWPNYFKSFQGSQNQPKNKEQKKKSIGWHSKQTLTKSPPCIMKSLMTRWNVEPL